jgi:NAD(P)-dependent dehydrogenase (short-subunit alcohol dehydrogenase family)
VKKTTPLGRFGETYEMAAALKFLASDDASFVNGVCLLVDGGWAISTIGMDQI